MVVSSVKELEMKKWLAAMFAAGVFFVGGFGQASAADWYYIDADADDAAWFIDNSSVYKTDDAATVLVKINNVEGFTYIYTVRIDRKEKTWQNLIQQYTALQAQRYCPAKTHKNLDEGDKVASIAVIPGSEIEEDATEE